MQRGMFQRVNFWLAVGGVLMASLLALGLLSPRPLQAGSPPITSNSPKLAAFPSVILWAWERPERLSFINPQEVGVAFLAKTLFVEGDQVRVRPRMQPLVVPPGTPLIAVVRIESTRLEADGIASSAASPLLEKLSKEILKLGQRSGISAIQVDFDARTRERGFYRELLERLSRELPAGVELQMTALASWCTHDNWLTDLPVAEAVPMVFRMGHDTRKVYQFLEREQDFRQALCRQTLGLAVDETFPDQLIHTRPRKIYLFNPQPWSAQTLQKVLNRISTKETHP